MSSVPMINTQASGELSHELLSLLMTYIPFITETISYGGPEVLIQLLSLLFIATLAAAWLYVRLEKVPRACYALYQNYFGFTEREIEIVVSTDWQFNVREETQHNILLQQAIKLYLSDLSAKAKYTDAVVELITPSEVYIDNNATVTPVYGMLHTEKELRQMKIVVYPMERTMQKIEGTYPPIYLNVKSGIENGAALFEKRKRITFTLRTYHCNGSEVLRKFIDTCYSRYVQLLDEKEETSRFIYQLQNSTNLPKKAVVGGDGGGDYVEDDDNVNIPPPSIFKKYKLSDEKTFDCLFFPGKYEILSLVSDFEKKSGKFEIPGFPQKLGLLLHGPPGTGKTSFVKALATHMKRHIISIPLGKITTNQQLYDIMLEGIYPCVGNESRPDRFGCEKVIYLMEEIDVAAKDVVRCRSCQTTDYAGDKTAAASFGINGYDIDCHIGSKSILKKLFAPADKLDLAGLLNILDGVVDSPGRVVILTTNHPEQLDAALIRPGRINRKILFTYILLEDFVCLVTHFFAEEVKYDGDNNNSSSSSSGDTTKRYKNRKDELVACWNYKLKNNKHFRVTPAEIEQLCIEFDTLDEFIEGFNNMPTSSSKRMVW